MTKKPTIQPVLTSEIVTKALSVCEADVARLEGELAAAEQCAAAASVAGDGPEVDRADGLRAELDRVKLRRARLMTALDQARAQEVEEAALAARKVADAARAKQKARLPELSNARTSEEQRRALDAMLAARAAAQKELESVQSEIGRLLGE